ncbi:MAG: hypothetical protein JNL60_01925, partial [Bacteroidia bacterium]|nr:hypothetical protein [Bacteroidia bacterium]
MTLFLLKNPVRRSVSFTLLLVMLNEIIFPTAAMALTSGPSQPEVQGFEPISTNEMVDISTGDFKYNIPLMDIEGYPLNLAYASGISTDQEASWVGLGWNLNVGAVNRAMRGLPDDFKGESIHKEMKTKPNRTYGLNVSVDFELFGKNSDKSSGSKGGKKFPVKPTVGIGVNYNNYNGFGVQYSVAMGISAGVGAKSGLNMNLGLNADAASGLDITPGLSYSYTNAKKTSSDETVKTTAGGSIGGTFNTRAGLKQITFGTSYSRTVEKTNSPPAPDDMPSNPMPEEAKWGEKEQGGSGKGCVNFGLQSYSPMMNWSMVNNSALLTVKFGLQLFGNDLNASIGGHYSSQSLLDNSKDVESYGYMYSDFAMNNRAAMLDFNREKDASYSRTTKNLPLTNFTYDVFNISGHGIGGAFRPFRGDVGHVYDVETTSQSDSYSLGADLSGGNLLKGGIDFDIVTVNSTSGRWDNDNNALRYFQFEKGTSDNEYEPYYFKRVGEMNYNPENMSLYTDLKGDEAYGIRIQQGWSNTSSNVNSNLPNISSRAELEQYNYDPNTVNLTTGANKVSKRVKRNQYLNVLTNEDAVTSGLQKELYNGTGVGSLTSPTSLMKRYNTAPGHHIAEISAVGPDGMRYYYGLPAYNTLTKECSFNISPATANSSSGFVSYSSIDASLGNEKGIDYYYSSTETPAYAYSYLLTAVVSPDYSDLNGNGPDDPDMGTYTKFHYTKVTGSNGDYEWRMPVSSTPYSANFNENSKTNNQDNMANYMYGKKETWYLDEIETRNYVAKFVLSDRDDAVGVVGEGGTVSGGVKSKRIDKIYLYSKKEYIASLQSGGPVAIPVKVVHFEYSYDLCSGIPNSVNGGGKLTLKKVYFTYGKSSRAVFNKYQFTYDNINTAGNPNYHPKAYDRWGNYKPVSGPIDYAYGAAATNPEFPYVEQNKTNADIYSSVWSIRKINLPSGAEITINYESDDYAFVQNIPAGQMFKVIGVTGGQPTYANLPGLTTLYPNTGTYNNYLIVDINNTSITNNADFIKYYLKDISEGNKMLAFRFLVSLTDGNASTPNFYEYVSGYADVYMTNGKGTGGVILDASGNPTGKAWVRLKEVTLKNKASTGPYTNPIAMTAMQYARLNHGNVIWGANYSPPEDVEEALKQLAQAATSSLKTMITGFKNPNKALADMGYCSDFVPGKSMIRLYNPDGKRLGGGSRVKSIAINDKWNEMTNASTSGQDNTIYEQEYTYETTDNGRIISSGVASYEPMVGCEENSMKQPFYLGKNRWAVMAPDDRYYIEGPFGESFYPAPNICYSRVKVKNKLPTSAANASTVSKNGYKIYEFYTAKDYPTITRHTPIMPKQYRSPLRSIVKIYQTDMVYASQGYVVVTNDMHGKPKSEMDFSETKPDNSPERYVKYFYKTNDGYQTPAQRGMYDDCSYTYNELNNNCKVIEKNGRAKDVVIGVDFDAIADFREAETETNAVASQVNLQTFMVSVVPVIVPTVWPKYQYEMSRFRSAVLTKVVNHYGILERTEVKTDESIVSSENIAYDSETGNVLVSKTTNNFNDPVYNMKFPAHWGYDLMGSAYKNSGLSFGAAPWFSAGQVYITNSDAYLRLGDEVLITAGGNAQKGWVLSNQSNVVYLGDQDGNPCSLTSGNCTVKIIRSGRRNLINNDMGVFTCLENPIVTVSGVQKLQIKSTTQVINANSVKYDDRWQIMAGVLDPGGCSCSLTALTSNVGSSGYLTAFLNAMFNWNSSNF